MRAAGAALIGKDNVAADTKLIDGNVAVVHELTRGLSGPAGEKHHGIRRARCARCGKHDDAEQDRPASRRGAIFGNGQRQALCFDD